MVCFTTWTIAALLIELFLHLTFWYVKVEKLLVKANGSWWFCSFMYTRKTMTVGSLHTIPKVLQIQLEYSHIYCSHRCSYDYDKQKCCKENKKPITQVHIPLHNMCYEANEDIWRSWTSMPVISKKPDNACCWASQDFKWQVSNNTHTHTHAHNV